MISVLQCLISNQGLFYFFSRAGIWMPLFQQGASIHWWKSWDISCVFRIPKFPGVLLSEKPDLTSGEFVFSLSSNTCHSPTDSFSPSDLKLWFLFPFSTFRLVLVTPHTTRISCIASRWTISPGWPPCFTPNNWSKSVQLDIQQLKCFFSPGLCWTTSAEICCC